MNANILTFINSHSRYRSGHDQNKQSKAELAIRKFVIFIKNKTWKSVK